MWNIRRLNKPSRSGKKDFFVGGSGLALIAEAAFVKMLHVEQKRTERPSRQHCTCGGAVTRSYLINWDQLQIVFICGTFTSIAKRFKRAQNKALNAQIRVAI
jgi:tRNA G37 N-methylase TrmD